MARRSPVSILLLATAALCSTRLPFSIPADPAGGMYDVSRQESAPLYLSWLQPRSAGGYELLFSKLEADNRWSNPRSIAHGDNWFINYADRPTIEVLPNRNLVAHWLVRNRLAKGNYGYGIEVAMSSDEGYTWRTIYKAGLSNVEDYTGFLSFLPNGKGFTIAYLAPPDVPVTGEVKTLRFAKFNAEGKVQSEEVLDADVCTCCPISSTMTPSGPVIAYRDHRANEIRDISIVRQVGGHWLDPQSVSVDGWQINGCPSDGPAITSKGAALAAAWFTRAMNVPKIEVAFSADSGGRFAKAVRVDAGNPLGRADVQLIDEQNAIVSWIEKSAAGETDVCVRRVHRSGRIGAVVRVGRAAEGRAAAFPKIRLMNRQLVVIWKGDRLVARAIPIPEY